MEGTPLIVLDFLLIMAWKNAGYVGLDRCLLGLFGTPWKPAPASASAPKPAL